MPQTSPMPPPPDWGIPQDATIGPYRPPTDIYGEPHPAAWFKRLMALVSPRPEITNDPRWKIATIPEGPPSAAGSRLLETEIPAGTTSVKPNVVDPETYNPLLPKFAGIGDFRSLIIDHNGHVIDLGKAMHSDAMRAIEPEIWKAVANPMRAALLKNKFVRVNYSREGIHVEMHQPPSSPQMESLTQLYESALKREPKIGGLYDLFDSDIGTKGLHGHGGAADILDKIYEMYYSRK